MLLLFFAPRSVGGYTAPSEVITIETSTGDYVLVSQAAANKPDVTLQSD